MRDATFVPDTKDILPLLSEMQTSHDQIVVVVDEYGGTATAPAGSVHESALPLVDGAGEDPAATTAMPALPVE